MEISEIKRLAKRYVDHAEATRLHEKALRHAIGEYCKEVRGGTSTLCREFDIRIQHLSDICHDRRDVSKPLAAKIARLKMS